MDKHQTRALQRKDQDAFLATQHGIKSPRIFSTFEEAKRFVLDEGGSIIARTEHPTEADGLSGLNYSHVITPEVVAEDAEKGGLFTNFRNFNAGQFDDAVKKWHKNFQHTRHYCRLFKIDPDEYVAKLQYSFWEYVSGFNLYMFADPVVDGRFHVFSEWPSDDEEHADWAVYDLFEAQQPLTPGRTSPHISIHFAQITALYAKVQTVFGNEVCWVVEMQLTKSGELYFLQRSTGPQVVHPTWSLAGEPENPWEFKVGLNHKFGQVIGITPKNGIETDVILERSTRLGWLSKNLPTGALGSHIMDAVVEQERLKQLAVYIETYGQGHGRSINDPHSSIVPMTRVPLYLHMPEWHNKMPKDIRAEIEGMQQIKLPQKVGVPENAPRDRYTNPDYMVRLKLNIRSDGREARVRVLAVC